MGLIEQAQRDMRFITGNAATGFAVALTFTAPDATTATINGLATKHSLQIDTQGNAVNSKNVHCSFSEALLEAEDYPVRTAGKIVLTKHLVTWTDATGTAKTYVIEDWMPDDTLGLIVCRLGTYTPPA